MSVDLAACPNSVLITLVGEHNKHLKRIETALGITILQRGAHFVVCGNDQTAVNAAAAILRALVTHGDAVDEALINQYLQPAYIHSLSSTDEAPLRFRAATRMVETRGANQRRFVQTVRDNIITFVTGPAGSGKTWLAVAEAVRALSNSEVERLILCRPAVEAGEKLGFLPGDISEKIDPYLQPLYDALADMYGRDAVKRLISQQIISLLPLAYMRGRTLNNAFVIVDEAQNATHEQIKMIITRIGYGTKMVVCGDVTQSDLPVAVSGLVEAVAVLQDVTDIGICALSTDDIVRHPIIARILSAYARNARTRQ